MIERTICTELNIGHGRLQVESFCGISIKSGVIDATTLLPPKVPRGYASSAPGHCLDYHACFDADYSALVDLSLPIYLLEIQFPLSGFSSLFQVMGPEPEMR